MASDSGDPPDPATWARWAQLVPHVLPPTWLALKTPKPRPPSGSRWRLLRDGYLATSMDQIAAAASVSKQTVYKQFADKQSLFREIVTGTVAQVSDPVAEQVASLRDSTDLAANLRGLARALLAQVLQPRVMQLRRLVIGEAGRFPELGRLFYDSGPGRTIAALAAAFEGLASRGALRLEDPRLAAEHFNWLVMSTPLNRVMLCGDAELPAQTDLDRYADAGARAFLAAYGAN